MTKVKAYFENSSTAELMAVFYDEKVYAKVAPCLEKLAKSMDMELSESVI